MSKVENRDVKIKTKNGQVHIINASDVSEDERVQRLWDHYSNYKCLKFIRLRDIWGWQSGAKQSSSNTIRMGGNVKTEHCEQNIIPNIEKYGLLPDKPPPVVYYDPEDIDGVNYTYKLGNVGNNTTYSVSETLIDPENEDFIDQELEDGEVPDYEFGWVYEVYEPVVDRWENEDIGWESNNTRGNILALNKASMQESLIRQIKGKRFRFCPGGKILDHDKLVEEIHAYIAQKSTISKAGANGVVNYVLNNLGVERPHKEYTPKDAEDHIVSELGGLKDFAQYDDETFGCIIKTGYMMEKIGKAMIKYHETGNTTSAYCYTGPLKDYQSTDDARVEMIKERNAFERAIVSAASLISSGKHLLELEFIWQAKGESKKRAQTEEEIFNRRSKKSRAA
jgi:hypothetical protein